MRLFLCAIVILVISVTANAAIQVHDASYSALVRSNNRMFPIAVDAAGTVFGVRDTDSNAPLQRIEPDGSTSTKGSANGVVGVAADLEIGFDGYLYANVGYFGSYSDGVLRIDPNTGLGSMFWTSPADAAFADGGLVFDPDRFRLYSISTTSPKLYSIDHNGNATTLVSNLARDVMGLAQDNDGDLLAITLLGKVHVIDPDAGTTSLLVDLKTLLPHILHFGSIAFDGASNAIWFTTDQDATGTKRALYTMQRDGTGLTLVATGDNLLNVAIGGRSDGLQGSAIYVSSPRTAGGIDQVFELRREVIAEVPEPSALIIWTVVGAVALTMIRRRVPHS